MVSSVPDAKASVLRSSKADPRTIHRIDARDWSTRGASLSATHTELPGPWVCHWGSVVVRTVLPIGSSRIWGSQSPFCAESQLGPIRLLRAALRGSIGLANGGSNLES